MTATEKVEPPNPSESQSAQTHISHPSIYLISAPQFYLISLLQTNSSSSSSSRSRGSSHGMTQQRKASGRRCHHGFLYFCCIVIFAAVMIVKQMNAVSLQSTQIRMQVQTEADVMAVASSADGHASANDNDVHYTQPNIRVCPSTNRTKRNESVRIDSIMDDLVITSGYWKIPLNVKNDVQQFTNDVAKTLKFFHRWSTNRKTVILYHTNVDTHATTQGAATSDPFEAILGEYVRKESPIHFKYTPLEDLRYDEARRLVLDHCQHQNLTSFGKMDKALQHSRLLQRAMQLRGDHTIVPSILPRADPLRHWINVISIWISKMHLVNQTLHDHCDKTYFAWMDGALATQLLHGVYHRTIQGDVVYFRPSITTWNHSKIRFRAGVMLGTRAAWMRVLETYFATLQDVLHDRDLHLCFDEEILMTHMWKRSGDAIRPYMKTWKDWRQT